MADLMPLAANVYEILRKRAAMSGAKTMTYPGLVDELRDFGHLRLKPNDSELAQALGEVSIACCNHRPMLPPLSALVGRTGSRRTAPGGGVRPVIEPYIVAHGLGGLTAQEQIDRIVEDIRRIQRVCERGHPHACGSFPGAMPVSAYHAVIPQTS